MSLVYFKSNQIYKIFIYLISNFKIFSGHIFFLVSYKYIFFGISVIYILFFAKIKVYTLLVNPSLFFLLFFFQRTRFFLKKKTKRKFRKIRKKSGRKQRDS